MLDLVENCWQISDFDIHDVRDESSNQLELVAEALLVFGWAVTDVLLVELFVEHELEDQILQVAAVAFLAGQEFDPLAIRNDLERLKRRVGVKI